ncbi:hypothetical protein D9M69_389380 [compost metagenome]
MQEENYKGREESRTIRDRIVALWDRKGLSARDLEKATGIDRTKWYSLRNARRRANEEDIMAIVEVFPCHALWLVSGKVAPEIGQVSPDSEAAS